MEATLLKMQSTDRLPSMLVVIAWIALVQVGRSPAGVGSSWPRCWVRHSPSRLWPDRWTPAQLRGLAVRGRHLHHPHCRAARYRGHGTPTGADLQQPIRQRPARGRLEPLGPVGHRSLSEDDGSGRGSGSVYFNADDRFCLDGQRLMLVSGTYGPTEPSTGPSARASAGSRVTVRPATVRPGSRSRPSPV